MEDYSQVPGLAKGMDGDVTKEDQERTVWTSGSIWVPTVKLQRRGPDAHRRCTQPPTLQQNEYVRLRRGLGTRFWTQRANREQS